jgi:low temperature requirement protein LtrA
MGRSAYHLIHPVMVAGIIVVAAGDQLVLDRSGVVGSAPVSAMLLGGAALFLTGHALFKAVVWGTVSRARIAGVAALGLLGVVAPHVTALVLSICTALVVLAVATADYLTERTDRPHWAARTPWCSLRSAATLQTNVAYL